MRGRSARRPSPVRGAVILWPSPQRAVQGHYEPGDKYYRIREGPGTERGQGSAGTLKYRTHPSPAGRVLKGIQPGGR